VVTLTHSSDSSDFPPTNTYREWVGQRPFSARFRQAVRDTSIGLLSIRKGLEQSDDWIRFPYYHHVFSDEADSFARQLKYLKNYGDFISLDDASQMLASKQNFKGRYFCLTFDDGLKCCATYALPVLAKLKIPTCFYIVTEMVGRSFDPDHPIAKETFSFRSATTSLEFMSWEDCQMLTSEGMTIGSHSMTHPKFINLDEDKKRTELTESKRQIEGKLGGECNHFCAPYGVPGSDFDLSLDSRLADQAGYASFATGKRGPNRAGDSPYAIRRDHLLAEWGNYQLKYFFSS